MNDEPPLDLKPLAPADPPDLVHGAVRRFRLHVVLFTTVAIVGAVALTAWGATAIVHARNQAQEREAIISPPQRAIAEDLVGHTCRTPTYAVDGADVTLLQAAPMSGGGWALHFVVDGKGSPLAVQRDGSPFWTTLVPVSEAANQGRVSVQPGATWGETYLSFPASAARRFEIQVVDAHLEVAGTFIVDLDEVLCDF